MTALRPVESWDVTPVEADEERKLLRKVVVNRTCAHPDCDRDTESVHHLFPRGTVGSAAWFVRVPGEEKPICHAIGLCGSGTTGHHGDLEEHRGWARLEDGEWRWYERDADEWRLAGPLTPQPGQGGAKKRRRKKPEGETRNRINVTVNVPKDERENGAEILEELIKTGRELWADELGWSESVPSYFVIVAAFAKAFQS